MIREIDVRDVLPAIHVPTLVIQRLGDHINPPCHGRYLASHIPGARYFEQPGDHSLRFAGSGDSDQLFGEIQEFLTTASPPLAPERVLTTILLATSARNLAPTGDAEPSGSPGRPADHEAANGKLVRIHRGRVLKNTRQGLLATFDAPSHAIRCAAAIRVNAATSGIPVAFGIHTGEVDLAGAAISGTSVRTASGVAALAEPAEILVSRTVKDLLAGSGISFTARGSHQLTGAAGAWPLFAVSGLPSHA
jgi:hypothetical protein